MNDNDSYLPERDDIEPDMALETANELRWDMMDFCINQIENEQLFMDESDLGDETFSVSIELGYNQRRSLIAVLFDLRLLMTKVLNPLMKKIDMMVISNCLGKNGCLWTMRMTSR